MGPAPAAKDATPPKALLWAYQLRKEHNALLYRLDEVAKIAEDAAAAQTKSADHVQSRVEGVVKKTEQEAAATAKALSNLKSKISQQETELTQYKQLWREERDTLERTTHTLKSRVEDLLAKNIEMERKLDEKIASTKEQIAQSKKRKQPPSERNPDQTSSLVSLDLEKSPALPRQRSSPSPLSPQLPSLWPFAPTYAGGTSSTHDRDTQSGPNPNPNPTAAAADAAAEIQILGQSPSESLAQYIARGERMTRILPRRKEGQVTDLFVDGLRDPHTQARFERALDQAEAGWTWANLMRHYRGSEAVGLRSRSRREEGRARGWDGDRDRDRDGGRGGGKRRRKEKDREMAETPTPLSWKIPEGFPPWWHDGVPPKL